MISHRLWWVHRCVISEMDLRVEQVEMAMQGWMVQVDELRTMAQVAMREEKEVLKEWRR